MKKIKPFNNKKVIRVTALLILTAFLITLYTPVQTEAAALKEEVVYVRLNNDGSLSQVYVVNSFQLGQDNEILDYGNYEYVRNLTDNSEIKLDNGKVTVDANGEQLYYEGYLMNAQLPWDISIKYILDGKEISPDEVAGKSGHLAIGIETEANPLGNKEFFDNYALQIALTLDSSLCKNITAQGGTVASAGSDKQVSYVVLPGKKASLELSCDVENFEMPGITIAGVRLDIDFDIDNYDMSELDELTDGVADLDDGVQELLDGIFDMKEGVVELHDGTIELGDGVVEFKDGIQELSEGTEELKDGVSELVDGTTEMADGVGELKDGTQELSEGTAELKDGVLELKDGTIEMVDGALELVDGTTELVDGVRELDDGVGEFADGIEEAYDGMKELVLGISKLNGGMNDITDGSADLTSGAKALASGASKAASGCEQLAGGFDAYFDGILGLVNGQLTSSASGIPTLNRDNYSAVLENTLNVVYGEAIATARDTVQSEVYAAARQEILVGILNEMAIPMDSYDFLPPEQKEPIDQLVNAQLSTMESLINSHVEAILAEQMPTIIDGVNENPQAKQLLGLLEMLKGYDQLLAGLNQYVSGVGEISSGTSEFSAGVGKFHDGLIEYKDGLSEYQSGIAQFYDESYKLVDGANELKEGTVELLDGVIELNDGIVEFKDGVIELRDGVIELFDGIVELHDGIVELKDGVIELNDGTIELRDGVIELFDGTVELHDGVLEMYDGAIELNDGVIELIDGVGELKDGTNDLYDGVAELKDGTGEFRSETTSLDTKIIDTVKEEIDKMMGKNAPVKSFVSEKNGEVSAVQFVMQTEGISIIEAVEASVDIEPEPTIWQRFIRLFGF